MNSYVIWYPGKEKQVTSSIRQLRDLPEGTHIEADNGFDSWPIPIKDGRPVLKQRSVHKVRPIGARREGMERKPVKSSNIKSLGHEGNVLEVEFLSGGIYQYEGVSTEEYEEMCKAESCGSHFHKNIKPKYAGVKQEPEKEEGHDGDKDFDVNLQAL
jgi:hypothetical protein